MLNTQVSSTQVGGGGLNPGNSIVSGIISANLGPDLDTSKYVFFEHKGTQVVKKINLADFFERKDNIGIHFLDDNIRDLPNKEILRYENPFSNGGKILNEKFPDKEVSLNLKVIAPNHYDLEATLTDLKTRFNNGGQLQINENGHLRYLDVALENFEVNAESGLGRIAEITVTFISLCPIKKSTLQTISELDKVGDLEFTVSILDSQEDVIPEFKILIKDTDNPITSCLVNYNGYDIEYKGNIGTDDNISFVGQSGECLFNNGSMDFDGVITDLKAGGQTNINISFEGGTPTYSVYITYNNLQL